MTYKKKGVIHLKKLRKVWQALLGMWWGFILSPILSLIRLPLVTADFVFLVHARVLEDAYLQFPILRVLPRDWVVWILQHLWPVVGPEITIEGSDLKGRTVFVSLTVEMMLEDYNLARERIQEAVDTSRRLGAKYLGPGALLPSLTGLGRSLRGNGMVISTGHTATSLLGSQQLLAALSRVGVAPRMATVAVAGVGSIGQAVTRQLAGRVHELILVDLGSKSGRLGRLKTEIEGLTRTQVTVHTVEGPTKERDYAVLKQADGVFTATSEPISWLKASMLKPGAVVVDDSQPLAMSEQEAAKHGGIVLQVLAKMPGVDCHFWFDRGVGRRYQYTCLAETVALAQHGNGTIGVVGPVTSGATERIGWLLAEAGYDKLVFVSFGRKVTVGEWIRAVQARRGYVQRNGDEKRTLQTTVRLASASAS